MNVPASASPWQPLTFGGVAAFAAGPSGRLVRVLALVSLICTGCLIWFVATALVPVLDEAVGCLPAEAGIRRGRLEWPTNSPVLLAHGPVLAVQVDPVAARAAGTASDFEVVLGPAALRLGALPGHVLVPYPPDYLFELSRGLVDPWWRAWQRAFLAGLAVASFLGLLGMWGALALVYMGPVKCIAGLAGRPLGLAAAWRLSAAAMVPAALVVSAAMVLYGVHRLPLMGLVLGWLVHWPVSWLYLLAAPLRLPRAAASSGRRANPFNPSASRSPKRGRGSNPFAGGRSTS